MGRKPCCGRERVNKGAWSEREDRILRNYIEIHGEGKWRGVPQRAGLNRCGKSCRLRWLNYLRPDIKRGNISVDEEELIIRLHKLLGNRWALIAGRLPGRTDNEIKNYWNTNLSKKALQPHKTHHHHERLRTESRGRENQATAEEATTESLKVIRTKAKRCNMPVADSAPLQLENLVPTQSDDISRAEQNPSSLVVGDQDTDKCIDFLKDLDIDELLWPGFNMGSCPDIRTKVERCTEVVVPATLQLQVPTESDINRAEQNPFSVTVGGQTVGGQDNNKRIDFVEDLVNLEIDEVFIPDVNVGSSTSCDVQTEVAMCTEATVPAGLELEKISPSNSDTIRTEQSPFYVAAGDQEKDECIDFLMDFDINEFLMSEGKLQSLP